jgi:DNA-binding transcriptional regulator of glucitol operon
MFTRQVMVFVLCIAFGILVAQLPRFNKMFFSLFNFGSVLKSAKRQLGTYLNVVLLEEE